MTELRIKALEKMSKEMNEKHNSYEDYIHNMLSDKEDEDLLSKILEEDKTIHGCYKSLEDYAYQHATREGSVGTYAMTPDEIERLVLDYYNGIVNAKPRNEKSTPKPVKEKVLVKPKTIKEDKKEVKEMSIFDFGVENE